MRPPELIVEGRTYPYLIHLASGLLKVTLQSFGVILEAPVSAILDCLIDVRSSSASFYLRPSHRLTAWEMNQNSLDL